jgi:hypothetical protein
MKTGECFTVNMRADRFNDKAFPLRQVKGKKTNALNDDDPWNCSIPIGKDVIWSINMKQIQINAKNDPHMKPASRHLHNKDMIISCRFHTNKLLNKEITL